MTYFSFRLRSLGLFVFITVNTYMSMCWNKQEEKYITIWTMNKVFDKNHHFRLSNQCTVYNWYFSFALVNNPNLLRHKIIMQWVHQNAQQFNYLFVCLSLSFRAHFIWKYWFICYNNESEAHRQAILCTIRIW